MASNNGFAGNMFDITPQQDIEINGIYINAQSTAGYDVDVWFRNAIHGPDQLRQRVAFALSEVLVVSELGDKTFFIAAIMLYKLNSDHL